MNLVFHDPVLAANQNLTDTAISQLAGKPQSVATQQIDPLLIFGDFIAGLKLLFAVVTGQTIATAMSIFPFVDTSVMLLIELVFVSASLFLWIYIISNRSI